MNRSSAHAQRALTVVAPAAAAPAVVVIRETLQERAERLWPGDPVMQSKWLAAIAMVRNSDVGWMLDAMSPRLAVARRG